MDRWEYKERKKSGIERNRPKDLLKRCIVLGTDGTRHELQVVIIDVFSARLKPTCPNFNTVHVHYKTRTSQNSLIGNLVHYWSACTSLGYRDD